MTKVPHSDAGLRAGAPGSSPDAEATGFPDSSCSLGYGLARISRSLIIVLAFEKHTNTTPCLGTLASFLPTPKRSETADNPRLFMTVPVPVLRGLTAHSLARASQLPYKVILPGDATLGRVKRTENVRIFFYARSQAIPGPQRAGVFSTRDGLNTRSLPGGGTWKK